MAKNADSVNTGGIWAPLSNISLASQALERAIGRAPNLPGVVTLHGPSGYGKTMSAAYCANRWNGIYVECRSFFTAKSLMLAILREAGIVPARTLAEMLDQINDELLSSARPLIVDEVDHIVETKALQLLRDIHDASKCALMLIGEEWLPRKLAHTERFHNRVLVWQPAAPATEADARQLARFYCNGVEIADDLLKKIHGASRAVARRICVNLDEAREVAGRMGVKRLDLEAWGNRPFYTGEAPSRRPV